MNYFYLLIVLLPLVSMVAVAFYSRRFVRDISDYIASGRVAGRYVMCVGDMTAGLSVIALVALCEQLYQCGMAITFWNATISSVGLFLALTGFCIYRFRQTRCLSVGQFWEQRYSRPFRIVAATVRVLAEMVTNAIGPAVAVRFFIYFLGIPHQINLWGFELKTYTLMVALMLICALLVIWPAGRISLLITDSIQGILNYPIFVVFTVFILVNISWFSDVVPVMANRVAGESFINPMDISKLRDFNLFALVVSMTSLILNRAAWIGNDNSNSAKNPHEQKMAGILGAWKNGFSLMMMTMVGIFVMVYMTSNRFATEAHSTRIKLTQKVVAEVMNNKQVSEKIVSNVSQLKPFGQEQNSLAPLSKDYNPDVQFFDTVYGTIKNEKVPAGNAVFQEFKALYSQMMMPTVLGRVFNPWLIGLFTLLMVMLLLSTDDSRIFNASASIMQDIILPLHTKPISTEKHMKYLKGCSLGVTIFFFVVSLCFAQLDYILMFTTIMCAIWLGAAGPIMIGGLYTKFGTTCGAWCALIFGSGFSLFGLICQQKWSDMIYPWLVNSEYADSVGQFLFIVSKPLHPYVVWEINPIKFPINSMEIYFMAMLIGIGAYVIGSLATYKEPFNLDRLFHRGKYSDSGIAEVKESPWTLKNLYEKLIGIDSEYTFGDKIISWSVFIWSIVFSFVVMFLGVLVFNLYKPLGIAGWGKYFFIAVIVAPLIMGIISTVWFLIGGVKDMIALFRDLKIRVANPLDNGQVEGHVSLVDKAKFDEIDHT